jgi:hypothetical protein
LNILLQFRPSKKQLVYNVVGSVLTKDGVNLSYTYTLSEKLLGQSAHGSKMIIWRSPRKLQGSAYKRWSQYIHEKAESYTVEFDLTGRIVKGAFTDDVSRWSDGIIADGAAFSKSPVSVGSSWSSKDPKNPGVKYRLDRIAMEHGRRVAVLSASGFHQMSKEKLRLSTVTVDLTTGVTISVNYLASNSGIFLPWHDVRHTSKLIMN